MREIAVDIIKLELKHTWMVHPPSRELISPLLSRVVKDGILLEIEDVNLLKRLFLRR